MDPRDDACERLADAFLKTLAARDFDGMACYFHPEVRSRLLIPPALLTPADATGLAAKFRQWFAGADVFEMTASSIQRLGERLAIVYTLRVHEADAWYVVQQQIYADVKEGRIRALDLLCSGFQPVRPQM